MEHPTLVTVFVAIIAFTSLLQTAFVVGLAVAARMGSARLAALRERYEREIAGHLARLRGVTEAAVRLSARGLEQAQRAESAMAAVEERVDAAFGFATSRLTEAAGRADEAVGRLARRSPIGRKLARASAILTGVRRALEVWRASA